MSLHNSEQPVVFNIFTYPLHIHISRIVFSLNLLIFLTGSELGYFEQAILERATLAVDHKSGEICYISKTQKLRVNRVAIMRQALNNK